MVLILLIADCGRTVTRRFAGRSEIAGQLLVSGLFFQLHVEFVRQIHTTFKLFLINQRAPSFG